MSLRCECVFLDTVMYRCVYVRMLIFFGLDVYPSNAMTDWWLMVVKALKLQRSVSQHVKRAVLDSDSAAGEYNERISTEWDGYKCVFIGF